MGSIRELFRVRIRSGARRAVLSGGGIVRVIQNDLFLCSDCTQVACNGPQGVELMDANATLAGLDALGPHLVPDFDSESTPDNAGGCVTVRTDSGLRTFSRVECAACHTTLAGYRARFAILGE